MKIIENITWTGIRPLVMHNGRLADPTDAYVRRIKEISSRGAKKLTDADFEERARLEWEAGFYFSSDHGPIMPADNIERCIQLGAQKARLGKDFAAAVFVSDDAVRIQYNGPRTLDEMYAQPLKFVLRKGVCVQKARIIRVRPMIPTGWKIGFAVEYDESVVNRTSIEKAMVDAGALCGLGDWRPRFGRFFSEIG